MEHKKPKTVEEAIAVLRNIRQIYKIEEDASDPTEPNLYNDKDVMVVAGRAIEWALAGLGDAIEDSTTA